MTATRRIAMFGGVGLSGIGVQLLTLSFLVSHVGVHYTIATVLAVATTLVHNFAWHRHWTWRDRRGGEPIVRTFGRFVAANGLVSLVGNLVLTGLLVALTGLHPVPANAAAIAACGVANFWLADRAVFRAPTSKSRPLLS